MIDLKTGRICFPDLKLELAPLSSLDAFLDQTPADRYHEIRQAGKEFTWYGLKEKIYEEDSVIPVWLRYDRENRLESVELYPQFCSCKKAQGLPSDAEDTEQKYCAAWLQRFCGLTWENSGYSWGTITTDYDARSDSCGIVIRYTKGSR